MVKCRLYEQAKALGTSTEFWYGMQVNYDLWHAKKNFRGKVKPIAQALSQDQL